MKRLLQFMWVSGALVVGLIACKRDLGNYDYSSPNTISITTDMATADPKVVINNDSIVVKQNDSLKVNVILSQTQESDDLSFSWMVTQTGSTLGNPGQYVVGNTQQLKTKILIPVGLYKLVVKVTDNRTGVSFYKFYSLNIDTSPWGNEGWIILQDQPADGGCDVSMITTRDGVSAGTVYNNVYLLANGHKLPVGTRKVNVMNYNATLRIQKVSFLYPNGAVQVRSTDFADSSYSDVWFLVNPMVNNIQVNGMVSNGAYEHVINNNQLYYRAVNATSIKTPPILFNAPVLGSWTLAPFVVTNNYGSDYGMTLYDQANKCFLLYNASTSALLPALADIPNKHLQAYPTTTTPTNYPAALDPITGSGFDMNNIGKNLVYTENAQVLTNSNGVFPAYDYFFRNNPGDSTWLYQIPSSATGYANNLTTGRYYLDPAKVTGINGASKFAVPYVGTPGKFYYVVANQVYACTIQNGAGSIAAPGLTFPPGTAIKTMKMFKSGYTTPPAIDGLVLVVATDETASGGGHKVYFFNLDINGNINTTPARVYTGFDKIIDIAFKKGLGL
jgi:hypothetical protein